MRQLSTEEAKKGLVEILLEVDRFCREEGLRYSLAYGTLLGAVRHKGIIPWDDDIDIMMPRPDFEKFVETFNAKTTSPYRVLYNTRKTDEFFVHFFAKVHNPNTISTEYNLLNCCRYGLNIDIFPVDGRPDSEECHAAFEKEAHRLARRIELKLRRLWPLNLHNPLLPMLSAHLRSFDYWFGRIGKYLKQYPFEGSRFAGTPQLSTAKPTGILPRETFENFTELEFEGHKMKCLADYDLYLTRIFGDYMTPPPENKRKNHECNVFEK